jgi:4-amino-4-deoxy-L-arabinose transferase-like glycosyltransferase
MQRSLAGHLWIPLWLIAALTAIFLTGLMPLYSTRTLGVAWEMWNSGQFLVPHSNGEPYSHKVPLLFWLIHLGWAVGGVGDVWPRVLEVLIGLGVLLSAQRLARVLFRESPATAALTPWLLAAFSYAFLFSLQIMYEMLLCLCVLGAMNALVGRHVEERPGFGWFALAVAAGLMTKGPVMLLHVTFPYLLGPLWHPWAGRERGRWYAQGGLALLAGFAVLLAWAIPAGYAGGDVYRNELFFMQTAGRVVDSFDHAQPWWWYASMLPMLALPWLLWPRIWQAGFSALADRRSVGLRFLGCWLIPVLIGFSIVSGKQAYYLLPEAAGGAILFAAGFARLAQRGRPASRWLGAGLLAAVLFAGAISLLLLPGWVAQGRITSVWYIDLATASPWFAAAGGVLGLIALFAPRDDIAAVRRIGAVSVVVVALLYAMFAQTLWPRFDLRPAARKIAALQAENVPLAHYELYENQFQFLGRLTRPLTVVFGNTIEAWAAEHPDGRIVHYVGKLTSDDLRHAELVQPFRSEWLLIERIDIWIPRRRGESVPLPATPAALYPPDYWPYRKALETSQSPSPP